jgi:DNA (cytosine-5)-methyltransferase 1
VDIDPQPRYPFTFVQADALAALDALLAGDALAGYRLADFDAIHASPPCQAFSHTQRIHGLALPELIAPTRGRLLATGLPYVIENVVGATAELRQPILLCGAMFPGLRVYRHRLFECSFPVAAPPHPPHTAPQVKMGRRPRADEWVQAVGNFSGVAEARDAMQMPWANRDGLREAVPPAYTAFIGRQLINQRSI